MEQIPLEIASQVERPVLEQAVPSRGRRVPNLQPKIQPRERRLAIIGEAPGESEEEQGEPFVGQSGRLLNQLLSRLGILRDQCFIGNVMQYRPPVTAAKKQLGPFDDWEKKASIGNHIRDEVLKEGIEALQLDLQTFNPNVCLLLGKSALHLTKPKASIDDWRGSLLVGENFLSGYKCIASYHPANIFRQYRNLPLLTMDIRRAWEEASSPNLVLPQRELSIHLSYENLCAQLEAILANKTPISCDIEGGVVAMPCLSMATSSSFSFLIPFARLDGSNYWTLEQEVKLWGLVARIMADPGIGKCWQSGLYDRFVLQWGSSIIVTGNSDDTLLKFWEYKCELPKDLGTQASILTREPFYKFERKTEDEDTFFRYCCKDSAVTFENNERLEGLLNAQQKTHYAFNNDLLCALLYMELRGIRYDTEEAKRRLAEIEQHVFEWQEKLDGEARRMGVLESIDFDSGGASFVLTQVQAHCCYKKDRAKPKASFVADGYWKIKEMIDRHIADNTPFSSAERGEISMLCGTTMNTKSYKKFQDFLYKTCKLPTQYKKDQHGEMRVTSDYFSLLKLSKNHDHPVLKVALELSRLRTRMQMLSLVTINGRLHCSYNLVGSETARVTCSKANLFVDGSKVGVNAQTIPDDWEVLDEEHPLRQGMRDLLLADEGCYLGKVDLKGADGWTIGAYMAMLGDDTMLEDLRAGLRPAQIVALILKERVEAYNPIKHDRMRLLEACQRVKKSDWQYFVSKIGMWGTCYTMGWMALGDKVFIESEGAIRMSKQESIAFQNCIFVRYPGVKKLQAWMQKQIDAHPYPFQLTSPNGFTRQFYGRKEEILGEVLAHLPQVVTTQATLTACDRLWRDRENRTSKGGLRCEPMHQVHDELLTQWKIPDTDWSIGKIKQWFDNEIVVAKQRIKIPFDGAYGTAWSMGEGQKVGVI